MNFGGIRFIVSSVLLLMFSAAAKSDEPLPKQGVHYYMTDWAAIRSVSEYVGKYVCIAGYLSFDGTGDSPSITLYETQEAMKEKRAFHNILVGNEHSMPLIEKQFSSGANNWRVLEGAYVEVSGGFSMEKQGSQHTRLGRIYGVKRIDVLNNGRVLLRLE